MSEQPPEQVGDPDAGAGRCPSCRARVVAGQQWCTLCHGRLDEPEPPADEPVRPGEPVRLPTGVDGRPSGPTPQGPADQQPPASTTLPPGVAEAMLAELAATTDRPLSGGPLAGRSRAVRAVLTVSAALVLTVVGVGLLALVGLLL